MPDVLSIIDLQLHTRIGVPAEERKNEQAVLVSVEMDTDVRPASEADAPVIDYDTVVSGLRALAGTERKTIERFAEDIAAFILAETPASGVAVRVRKMPFPDAKEVRVEIRRAKSPPYRKGPLIA